MGDFLWVEQEQRRTKKMMKNVLKNEQERSNSIGEFRVGFSRAFDE